MNEIELVDFVDLVERMGESGIGVFMRQGMSVRDTEIANMELERRGSPARVLGITDMKITRS